VTIKFNDNNHIFDKLMLQKIKKKSHNFFSTNTNTEENKREWLLSKAKMQKLGAEDALIIEALHFYPSHYEEERKGHSHCCGVASRNSRKEGRSTELFKGDATSIDFRHFGKQIMRAEYYKKVRVNLKQSRMITELMDKKQKKGNS
jgi:hypothetical protein